MSVRANLESVHLRIESACTLVHRDPSEITLIAVSKNHPIDAIREAYDLGQRHFGESKLQEAVPKIEQLPNDVVWHFIGTLQSNKARRIASLFPFVHTLCKESQLFEVEKAESPVEGFIEVNLANEPQKSGLSPDRLDEYLAKLLQSKHVHFRGLMGMGPAEADPGAKRTYFRLLRCLGEKVGALNLSMGMSDDFELAVQEGASHIRVGTAIFGSRQY
ncbi:MAG: YggS family pyridoxal phosphate-dependent enzyme [Fimbriimonas sp.]|nr:YggS family pyridoxal phosphate-dependent enzyme [Fimbriimonas sp.]